MTSNQLSPQNSQGKKLKFEHYTPEVYQYLRSTMSPNLAFIKDNGHTLEIETFFQLCIIELERIPSNTNRAIQGFKQAKINIDEMLDYDEKMQALSLFFETYHLFFEIPGTMILSGAVQGLIATTLSKNPTL